jgi:hypothetical protein
VALAEDETDLLLFPPPRSAWSPRGEPARVLLSGWNARRAVFGATNLRTGTRLLLDRPKGRGPDFRAFLGLVRAAYRGWHVALLLGENPSHTACASREAAEGMTLLWPPKRSPELNPMDTLWGQAKDVISADHQYASIQEQTRRFLDHLGSLTNAEALRTSGVPPKSFWLRNALSKDFCRPA